MPSLKEYFGKAANAVGQIPERIGQGVQDALMVDEAMKFGEQFPGGVEGVGDAARHQYWTGRMAQKYSSPVALAIGYAHELLGLPHNAKNPKSGYMDLANNLIGTQLGQSAGTPERLAQMIQEQALRKQQSQPSLLQVWGQQ